MATESNQPQAAYQRIIASGEAALLRWSATNPMRATVERQVADARRQLGAGGESFPQPQRRDGKESCGECRLRAGETCDICGASA